jgi:hypothetical protein
MEPRLRNSSGPVEAMPKHKQAGHTTVLTKMRNQHNKTLAMQVPPTQDVHVHLKMLQCGPSLQTFAATPKSSIV